MAFDTLKPLGPTINYTEKFKAEKDFLKRSSSNISMNGSRQQSWLLIRLKIRRQSRITSQTLWQMGNLYLEPDG